MYFKPKKTWYYFHSQRFNLFQDFGDDNFNLILKDFGECRRKSNNLNIQNPLRIIKKI